MNIQNTAGATAAGETQEPQNTVEFEQTGSEATDANGVKENEPANTAEESDNSSESEDKPQSEEGSEKASKKKSGSKRLRERNEALIAEVARLQALSEVNAAKESPETKKAAGDENKRPSEADFDNVVDYIRADNAWLAADAVAKALKADKEATADAAKKAETEAEFRKKADNYNSRMDPIMEANPEYLDTIGKIYQAGLVTPPLESAIVDSPVGEQITLHFIQNPQELKMFKTLSEAQTYKVIGLLEARFENAKSSGSQGQQAAVRTTKAAAPITPIGKKTTSTGSKAPEEMSQVEYEAWRYPDRRGS